MQKFCHVCGKELPENAQFCINCGTKAADTPSETVQVTQPANPPPPVSLPNEPINKFCIKCGTPLADDDVFCYVCGTPVGQQENAQGIPPQQLAPGQTPPPIPGTPASPEKNSSGKAPVIVAAIAAAIAVAAVATLIVVLVRDKDSESSDKTSSSASTSSAAAETTSGETTSETTSAAETSSSTTETDTTSNTTTTSTTTTTTTTSAATASTETTDTTKTTAATTTETAQSEPVTQPSPDAYSTSERPSLEDFAWFNNAVAKGNIPSNAEYYDDLSPFLGSWKAVIITDMDRTSNNYSQTLLNCVLDYGQSDIVLTLDWYRYVPEFSEWDDMTDQPDMVLRGYNWGSGIKVNGDIEITIDCFYEYNGKQYAIGRATTYDGTNTYIGMVRP